VDAKEEFCTSGEYSEVYRIADRGGMVVEDDPQGTHWAVEVEVSAVKH
jgi:hypothetical protein